VQVLKSYYEKKNNKIIFLSTLTKIAEVFGLIYLLQSLTGVNVMGVKIKDW